MKTKSLAVLALILLSAFNSQFTTARAQGTNAFTYQGQLHDNGTNANGNYTMIFSLYDAVTSGNLVAGPVTNSVVLANGLFSINLDFGAGAFNGAARWLDITITTGGTTQELSPRVQVLPAPYALYAAVAATVTNGAIMNAQIANGAVTAAKISGAVAGAASVTNGIWSIGVGDYQTPNGGPVLANSLLVSEQGVVQGLFSSSKSLYGVIGDISCNTNHVNAIQFNGSGQMISADSQGDVVGLIPQMQLFSSSGTFVVPTNVTRIMVELWGGGGGGGGNGANMILGTTYYVPGGGGGGGGFAINVLNVTPGTSYTITIGAGGGNGGTGSGGPGGTTTFGALMTAGGGSGGTAGAGTSNYGVGGNGGGGENGSTLFQGGFGQPGGGNGGGAGGSAVQGGSGGWQSGGSGGSPGGGGGGGGATGEPTGSVPGNGAAGAAIIYY